MWIAVLAGILVSLDALFIGISFGTQKRCRFWHVLIINAVLLGLCMLGYILGILIGESIGFETDLIVGLVFIALGVWVVISYFLFERRKTKDNKHQMKSIVLTGTFMSAEAMFITVGLTLSLDVKTIFIPITVALAHLVFSFTTFFCAKSLRRLKPMVGQIISGVALIIYGILAIVV